MNLLSLDMGMVGTVMLTSYYDNQCRCNIHEVFILYLELIMLKIDTYR